jgi:hypothetical protein
MTADPRDRRNRPRPILPSSDSTIRQWRRMKR